LIATQRGDRIARGEPVAVATAHVDLDLGIEQRKRQKRSVESGEHAGRARCEGRARARSGRHGRFARDVAAKTEIFRECGAHERFDEHARQGGEFRRSRCAVHAERPAGVKSPGITKERWPSLAVASG
jgi:hypothetical protein